jgi:hypothetical protein
MTDEPLTIRLIEHFVTGAPIQMHGDILRWYRSMLAITMNNDNDPNRNLPRISAPAKDSALGAVEGTPRTPRSSLLGTTIWRHRTGRLDHSSKNHRIEHLRYNHPSPMSRKAWH